MDRLCNAKFVSFPMQVHPKIKPNKEDVNIPCENRTIRQKSKLIPVAPLDRRVVQDVCWTWKQEHQSFLIAFTGAGQNYFFLVATVSWCDVTVL